MARKGKTSAFWPLAQNRTVHYHGGMNVPEYDPDAPAATDAQTVLYRGRTHVRRRVERLRRLAALEATTLLMLLIVAVPLKHLAHVPAAVAVMGPIHGLVFLGYAWTLIENSSAEGWKNGKLMRLFFVGLLPFGGYVTATALGREAARLPAR